MRTTTTITTTTRTADAYLLVCTDSNYAFWTRRRPDQFLPGGTLLAGLIYDAECDPDGNPIGDKDGATVEMILPGYEVTRAAQDAANEPWSCRWFRDFDDDAEWSRADDGSFQRHPFAEAPLMPAERDELRRLRSELLSPGPRADQLNRLLDLSLRERADLNRVSSADS